jgi:hypothetical protein
LNVKGTSEFGAIIAGLRQRVGALRSLGVQARLDVLAAWAADFEPDPADIAVESGLSPQMVAWGIRTTVREVCDLGLTLDEGLGDRYRVGGFRAHTQAVMPDVVGHVWARTLPTSGWLPVLTCLAAGSACVIKAPRGARSAAELLRDSLPDLFPVAVHGWAGGEDEDEALVQRSGAVIVSGGVDAIERYADLTRRRQIPFVPFGPGCSIAVVPAETDVDVAGLALDVAAYDQRGCLSPQSVWVERGRGREVAQRLAMALSAAARDLPRGELSDETAAAIMQRRASAAFRGEVLEAEQATVLYEPEPHRWDTPLHRTVAVHEFDGGAVGLDSALPEGLRLHAAGVSGPPDTRRAYAAVLARRGVSRVCAPGRMQTPPAGWHHDGLNWLARIAHFVDVEE